MIAIPRSSTPLNEVVLPPTLALSFTAIAKSIKFTHIRQY